MLSHAWDLLGGSWRYSTGLRSFLIQTIDLEDATRTLTAQLQTRDDSFLQVLNLGVYGNPRSPYRRILLNAGIEFGDVRSLVKEFGVEGALARLYDAGVFVTLDEFKGRAPIRRPNLEFPVQASDFDNPFLSVHYQTRTGGSRSGGTRLSIDFDFIAYESAALLLNFHANGISDRPVALWVATPPSTNGLNNVFRLTRAGLTLAKWFTPSRPLWNRQGLQGRALMSYTRLASRLFGRPILSPEYLPNDRVKCLARWLAEAKQRGKPAVVFCFPGPAVRICLAAEEAGVDISGTVFYSGGEAYTEGKAAVQRRVGARQVSAYSMSEIGPISFSCGKPAEPDDMHIRKDKVAILQRRLNLGSGATVDALFHTNLLTSAPKLMLNVESGDYAVLEERDCGCLWQSLGLTTHLHTVRSYEKLTGEGVMFLGSMLHSLLEEILPGRFGGSPLDYQLVEEEERGLPRVSLIVSPSVGPVDEDALVETVLRAIGSTDWSRRMADSWRAAGTVRVKRGMPYATQAGKVLPLHLVRPSAE